MAMSSRISLMCAFVALSAAFVSAAHSAPAPGVDCSSLVMNMAECLSYVTIGETAKKPEGTCCSGLKTVLKTDAECLCEAFKNSAQLGVTLNVTKAMGLPAACHLSAPSIGNCAVSTAPGAAPALSPVPLSPSSSITGAPEAGTGATEAAPVPSPGGSGSSALTTSIEFLFVTTIVAAASLSFSLF